MKLIVGLGNPGQKYVRTRHNVGFEVIAQLAEKFDPGRPKARFHGETVDFQLVTSSGSEKVVLLSPLTYMNESGRSVRAAVDFFQLEVETDLLVVCDDFNLDFAKLRLRPRGSSGGQRGLEDIIRNVGKDFCRLRIGVGRPPQGWDVADYVLSRFREEEADDLKECVSRAADAAMCWCEKGISEAMNQFNVTEAVANKTEESELKTKKKTKHGEQAQANANAEEEME